MTKFREKIVQMNFKNLYNEIKPDREIIIHQSIVNIVLSAVTGNELEMEIRSPIEDSPDGDFVTLRNGSSERKGLIAVIMSVLEDLMKNNPIAFYDFVSLVRDPKYKPFGNSPEILEDLRLVQIHVKK